MVSEVQVADIAGNLDELPVVYDLATCTPVKPYTQPIYVPGSTAVNYLLAYANPPHATLLINNKPIHTVPYITRGLI